MQVASAKPWAVLCHYETFFFDRIMYCNIIPAVEYLHSGTLCIIFFTASFDSQKLSVGCIRI
jgi:hypothetical protein